MHQVKFKDFTFANITEPGKTQIKYLQENFPFHWLDLKDVLPPLQHPKLVVHEDYIFMVLLFPVYNRANRQIKPAEVNVFITQDSLIVVHDKIIPELVDLTKRILKNEKELIKEFNQDNQITFLFKLIDSLLNECFPMLNHINNDTEAIEDALFAGNEQAMVKEILLTKRNIASFRKTMQAHRNVYKRFMRHASSMFPNSQVEPHFLRLIDHTRDIWELLENYRETIHALHDTNESLISFRLNDIMKTLTIFSVVVFPLSLIAGIFGMNTVNMPLVENPNSFWIVMAVMSVATLAMFIFFKIKKWL